MRVGHEELEDAAVTENDAAALVDELPDVFADDRTKGVGCGGLHWAACSRARATSRSVSD